MSRPPQRRRGCAVATAATLLVGLLAVGCADERRRPANTTSTLRSPSTTQRADVEDGGAASPDLTTPVRLVDLGLDLDAPIAADAVPGTSAMVVAERAGVVHEVRVEGEGAVLVEPPLLDVRRLVGDASGERGLLGVAVAPDAASLVLSYTSAEDDGSSRVDVYELVREPDGLRVDRSSRRELLAQDQPFPNHNGGHVEFGPDGLLYLGLGDGGAGGDPQGNAQNPATLLGKLLRLDPDAHDGVPDDNPFVGRRDARPEIWATGLRNPWRFSFDAATGDLWVADVGQNSREEINHLPAAEGAGRGANFGWDLFEAEEPFDDADPAPAPWSDGPFVRPRISYGRSEGCSVTGGVVYRGDALPGLRGAYLFADYCGRGIRAFDPTGDDVAGGATELAGGALDRIVAFAEGPGGEVVVLSLTEGVFLLASR